MSYLPKTSHLIQKYMKTKSYLIILLIFAAFTTFAQTEINPKGKSLQAVTSFKASTDTVEELKNFDWKILEEMFKQNDKNQEISIEVGYKKSTDEDKTKMRVSEINYRVVGKTADLDLLIAKLQRMTTKLNVEDFK